MFYDWRNIDYFNPSVNNISNSTMSTATECVCCKEIEKIKSLIERWWISWRLCHIAPWVSPRMAYVYVLQILITSTDINTMKQFKTRQSKFTVIRFYSFFFCHSRIQIHIIPTASTVGYIFLLITIVWCDSYKNSLKMSYICFDVGW